MQNNFKNKKERIKVKTITVTNFSAFLLVFIFLISSSSASMQVGIDGSLTEIGINFDRTPFNISKQTVNSSNYWITDIGVLGTANSANFDNVAGTLTIDESWLESVGNSLWCKLTGCTMSDDIDMDGNDILNVKDLNASGNITASIFEGNCSTPIADDNIVNKKYVDDEIDGKISDGTAQGQMGFWDASLGKWVETETSELFWDDVNKRLGIGTSTPGDVIEALGGNIILDDSKGVVTKGDNMVFRHHTSTQLLRLLGQWNSAWIDNKPSDFFQFGQRYAMFSSFNGARLYRFAFISEKTIFTDSAANAVQVPQAMLQVYVSTIDGEVARFESNDNNIVVIDKDGQLGINTTTPDTTLHVVGNTTVEGNGNFTGTIFADELNLTSGASINFLDVEDYIAKMSAQEISIPVINISRTVLATDADSFGNNVNYDGTSIITSLNTNDSTYAASATSANNILGYGIASIKWGPNYTDPNAGYIINNFGNTKYMTRNDEDNNISFTFYDKSNRDVIGNLRNYTNSTDVITILSKNHSIPFKTLFSFPVEFIKNVTFDSNLTVNDYGFFNFIGSITNRITKIWASSLDVSGDINQTSGNSTINLIYGGLANYSSAGWTFELPTSGIYYNVTNLSVIKLNGFDFVEDISSAGGSQLITQVPGTYEASGQLNFKNGANQLYGGGIAVNGVINRDCYDRQYIGTVNVYSNLVYTPCIIELNVNDTISLQVEDETAPSSDITIYNARLYLKRIGE